MLSASRGKGSLLPSSPSRKQSSQSMETQHIEVFDTLTNDTIWRTVVLASWCQRLAASPASLYYAFGRGKVDRSGFRCSDQRNEYVHAGNTDTGNSCLSIALICHPRSQRVDEMTSPRQRSFSAPDLYCTFAKKNWRHHPTVNVCQVTAAWTALAR